MDADTGELHASRSAALEAGVRAERLVMLGGPPKAVRSVSAAVKAKHREKMARKSRRVNQGKR